MTARFELITLIFFNSNTWPTSDTINRDSTVVVEQLHIDLEVKSYKFTRLNTCQNAMTTIKKMMQYRLKILKNKLGQAKAKEKSIRAVFEHALKYT